MDSKKELNNIFTELLKRYDINDDIITQNWNELIKYYASKKRYYHNITHIHNAIAALSAHKDTVDAWDVILFASFYHDIIYNTNPLFSYNNEKKSAELFMTRYVEYVPYELCGKVYSYILATESHTLTNNESLNLFIDADMSILGQDKYIYNKYTHLIRQEYKNVPDFLYRTGRVNVLQTFLSKPTIFLTESFTSLEERARENIMTELNKLNNESKIFS